MTTFLTGLVTGFSLIGVIGVQNALVLRQGLRREHVGLVVGVCTASDVALIAAGTAGVGAIVSSHPTLLNVMTWVGALYLTWLAIGSFRSAARPRSLVAAGAQTAGSVLATVLAVTWLNPHVYLDTVVMLGSVASSHGDARWTFAAGAMAASVAWFGSLGFAARALSGPLSKPSVWRAIDLIIGVVILVVAVKLVWH